MEDKFTRYSKLYFLIFLLFLSVPVIIGLIIGTFWGFSKVLSVAPTEMIYTLLIMSVPCAIFSSAYYIFFRRTRFHPSNVVRVISRTLFTIGFCLAIVFLVLDIITYFHKPVDVGEYRSFNTWYLAGNIGGLFIIAIMQAFTMPKEKDWMEK
jgi:hypothetical protein